MDRSKALGLIGRRRSGPLLGFLLAGAAIGIGATLLLDPVAGRRRRGLIRDKLSHYGRVAERRAIALRHNAQERIKGRMLEARAARLEASVDDETIVQRVRSAMGRHVQHAHPIVVTAELGVVKLSGPILASDMPGLLAAVRAVRGVRAVQNALEVHSIGDIPVLRGNNHQQAS